MSKLNIKTKRCIHTIIHEPSTNLTEKCRQASGAWSTASLWVCVCVCVCKFRKVKWSEEPGFTMETLWALTSSRWGGCLHSDFIHEVTSWLWYNLGRSDYNDFENTERAAAFHCWFKFGRAHSSITKSHMMEFWFNRLRIFQAIWVFVIIFFK